MRGEINMQLDAHKEQLSALHKHLEILMGMGTPNPVAPALALAKGEEGAASAPAASETSTPSAKVPPDLSEPPTPGGGTPAADVQRQLMGPGTIEAPPKLLLADRQRALEQRQCLFVIAHRLVKPSKVIYTLRCDWMRRPKLPTRPTI